MGHTNRILVAFFTLINFSGCVRAEEIVCNKEHFSTSMIENFRKSVLIGDIESLVEVDNLLINVQLQGSMMKMDLDSIEYYSEKILSSKIKTKIKHAKYCELVKYFGLKKVDEKFFITQMIFNFDHEDLRFSSSGIPSASELNFFVSSVNSMLTKKKFRELKHLVHYPFFTENKKLIENEQDFENNLTEIVSPKFAEIMRAATDEKNYHHHYTGIKLNENGDIWIQYFDDALKLVILN